MSELNSVLVMLGGFIGAILRFLIGELVHSNQGFPFETLTVNLLGCFLLGGLFPYYKVNHPKAFLLVGTGLIGAFTTFSTFSIETLNLLRNDDLPLAVVYVLSNVIGGLCLTMIGLKLGSRLRVRNEVGT
jgi:CrcB protein